MISGVREKAIDVLVVEDDDDSRRMFEAAFTAHGYLVRGFASADLAHEAALARVPDVVVTDLLLIGGSAGWTLAEALREEPRTRHVALIAVTGDVDPHAAVVTPFDVYLRKPVELDELMALVEQLAQASRAQRRQARAAR